MPGFDDGHALLGAYLAARSGSGFDKMLWLLIDSLCQNLTSAAKTLDMGYDSTLDMTCAQLVRSCYSPWKSCLQVLAFRCWTSLWSCLDERIMWDKQLAGSSSVLLQLWHARKNTKAMEFFFCARLERLLVRSGGDEIARSDDLIAVIQDGSFHGMTVAPEAFELFYHGLPRWSARACELLKLQNLC